MKIREPFFRYCLGDFGLLAPDNNLVPLGALLAFAVAIFIGFVGGDGENWRRPGRRK